ncbi:hypothetical protein [Peptostreptococcus sp. D1]|uniref:hypothetical protein n=1 Tax=Peptostreptococcus sp. D1 TaxID=72304 RepID=UPI0008F19A95|nr:hypothetical protein [Peptostreptococcus sp. D1]SFE89824.1 hypothetical protein SAMN02910278_01999 [Peptostreptococcus sp. D1]
MDKKIPWNGKNVKEIPCFGCSKRQIGCHSVCETYIYYSEKRKKELEKKHNSDDFYSLRKERAIKYLRRGKR